MVRAIMDIFTTQLVRLVPVPIKPANLKVKALLKEARTSKLKEDPEHLESHNYYFDNKQADNDTNEENEQELKSAEHKSEISDDKSADTTNDKLTEPESKGGVKHLDLYV
jgi:hypothetical protein